MTRNLNFDQIADYLRDGENTTIPTDHPAAPLWAMLEGLTRTTPAEDVHRAATAAALGLPDDVLFQALTPIDPDVLAGDEAQYATFRQALLDEAHSRALGEAAAWDEQACYDRTSREIDAAATRTVNMGTEWHAPINAAVEAAIDSFVAHTTPDQRLLGMLKSLPDVLHATAGHNGYTDAPDDVRTAFQAGCALITEAVEAWLTTHTVVALPVLTANRPNRVVVEVDDPNEVVVGFRDDNGNLFVQAGYVVWKGATAEQIALGTLAVLHALRAAGGER